MQKDAAQSAIEKLSLPKSVTEVFPPTESAGRAVMHLYSETFRRVVLFSENESPKPANYGLEVM